MKVNQVALLSFYLLENSTIIYWYDHSSMNPLVFDVPLKRSEIAKASSHLKKLFAPENIHYKRPERTTDLKFLKTIGDILLAPIAQYLDKCKNIVVSPHGELHDIPFHILSFGNNIPLGLTHQISYVPNISMYAGIVALKRDKIVLQESNIVSAAVYAKEDPLHVKEKFAATPRLFAEKLNGEFLEGSKASYFSLLSEKEIDILYLSCHGYYNSQNPLESFLLLSDGLDIPSKTQSSPGSFNNRLSVETILGKELPVSLIILDACMSGMQAITPGDEAIGFPSSFLLSGVQTIISTNWVVEQNSSDTFVSNLLKHWTENNCHISESMQEAYKCTYEEYPHPFHWAAFSLFGNNNLYVSN